jgi:malonate decarboxylase beta subunit
VDDDTAAVRDTVIALFAQGVPAVHRSDRAQDFLASLAQVDTARQATAQDVRAIYSKGLE